MRFQFPARHFALALALAAGVSHADSFFMKIKGQKTGEFKGGVTIKGREGAILVQGISHGIVSPRDPQSGLPTGQRQHSPMIVTIPLDQSVPLLYNALITNENLSTLGLSFYSKNVSGNDINLYNINLTNANIASIQQTTTTDANGQNPLPALKVTFTYQKIQWTWTTGGTSATDSWEARN